VRPQSELWPLGQIVLGAVNVRKVNLWSALLGFFGAAIGFGFTVFVILVRHSRVDLNLVKE
ncbi:MAG: hypothetical protein LBF38_08200, partial [Deltaproteobacteria bacterium]|nr:hypothetical protein [Deltaproteobacteria bacterium]